MTLHEIIRFFITYKYLAIFPIAVLEGPIITVVSGFLVSRGHLELFPALLVVFMGDVVSDSAFYLIGKWGRMAVPYLKFLHISDKKIQELENRFESSPWKTMILGKVWYGLGAVFMIASGASRMSWKKFLEYVLSLDFLRSFVLLSVGYYFGKVALHFGSLYFKYYTTAVIILVPTGYLIYRKRFKKAKQQI